MTKLSIETNTKELVARLQARQNAMKANSPQLNEAFIRIGLRIQTKARINASRQKPPVVDRGSLRQAINYKFFNAGDQSGILIGVFGIPYAAINEFGGIVTRDMLKAMFAANRNRLKKIKPRGVITINPGDKTGTWRERPYLMPAFRSEKEFITKTIATALGLK